ncbi:MAG: type I 3-dehydroquinate dehydratase [Phycisphaerales bacterium]
MTSLVCVPIMVLGPEQALRDARAAKDQGADLVELRIDEVFQGDGDEAGQRLVFRLVADCPLPCIITCRPASEGGHYDGYEPSRIALFERLATSFGTGESPPRYIDVELSTYTRSANIRQKVNLAVDHPEQSRDLSTSLILSTHDYDGRPADLTRRILRMQEEAAPKVLKVAWRARSLRDTIEVFDLLAQRDRPTIALAMGEFGLMSRVLAPKFGGFLTFASLRPETATAPGQPTVRELLDLYRFRSIGPGTAVYGVIGYPLGHSLSPLVHNAGFEAAGLDAVYLPLPVPGGIEGGPIAASGGYENLKATLGELLDYGPLNLRGASVTSPHKENLARLAVEMGWEMDEVSASIRAANTLTAERDPDGSVRRVRVSNTDAPALSAIIRDEVGEVAGRSVAVIGAGGVARAAVYALATGGARVSVFSRRWQKSVLLAESSKHLGPGEVVAEPLSDLARGGFAAIIHGTPQGMSGGLARTAEERVRDEARQAMDEGEDKPPARCDARDAPVAVAALGRCPGAVLIETVYNPVETPLLLAARAAGLPTVDGLSMFVRQAGLQFEGWTGGRAPLQLFDRLCREALVGSPA